MTSSNVSRLRPGWIAVALVAVTVAAYSAAGSFDFINLDDPHYVYANPQVKQGLTWSGVQWAFSTAHATNWHPLTWISHMVDVELFGVKPGPHHWVNVLLHVVNTLLLFGLLRRTTGATGRSALVAALFAVHPLHVESVVWISERKDVLSTMFFMLTLWAYSAYARKPVLRRYVPVFVLLALGLMAKPMLVTLPFVLLLLDVWPLQRIGTDAWDRATATRLVVEKIPLFALVAASSVVTFIVQRSAGAVTGLETLPLALRLANTLVSYLAYIGTMVWPAGLTVMYPFPDSIPLWKSVGALALLAAASLAAVRALRRYPYLTVGWFWYVGMLVPVIGLVQVGTQAMADRYTYVSLIGLFLIITWGGYDLLGRLWSRREPLAAVCVLATVVLAVATWVQSKYWLDAKTLWARSLDVTTENYRAHALYGMLLVEEGLKSEAIEHFTEAIRILPAGEIGHGDLPPIHTLLGGALADLGRPDEAIPHYREALRLRPDFAPAHNGLGNVLAGKGLLTEAISYYEQVLRIEPDDPLTHNRLGVALAELGRTAEAIPHYREALRPMLDFTPAHYSLGNALAGKGLLAEAITHYEQALSVNPDDPLTHNRLAVAFAELGRPDEAIPHYREALRLRPDFAPAHNSLGNALAGKGLLGEAISHYKQALDLEPDNPLAHNGLGSALDDLGHLDEAIGEYRKALAVDPEYAAAHNNLATAYVKSGRFDEAISELRAALQFESANADYHYNYAVLLRQQGDIALARQHLGNALSLNPQFQDALQALASLPGGDLEQENQP